MTKYLRATAMAGLSFVAATALADSVPEIVVEAAAPVNHKPTGEGSRVGRRSTWLRFGTMFTSVISILPSMPT